MKKIKLKNVLFFGTMFLTLLGTTQQLSATSSENLQLQQQIRKVSGTVTDPLGPIPGVTLVEMENPANGTVSDMDGNFELDIPVGSTLVISAIGYKTQQVAISAIDAPLYILLEEDSQLLDDVVVTALGIKRERKALGYGLEEVAGEALTKARETNVINSMAGRVAGLVVSQTAGGPSGSTRVILRGSTEMTGNNQPLYRSEERRVGKECRARWSPEQ